MANVDELLGRGEHVLHVARPHISVLMGRLVVGITVIAMLVAAGMAANNLHDRPVLWAGSVPANDLILISSFVLSVIMLFSGVFDYFRWRAEQYYITDRRIIQVYGVLNTTSIDASLGKIQDVVFSQSFAGRLCNFGTLRVHTAAENAAITMLHIGNPRAFHHVLREAKHHYDQGYGYLAAHSDNAAPAPVPQRTFPQALEELARLHDRGILSSAEFEAKKREILNRI